MINTSTTEWNIAAELETSRAILLEDIGRMTQYAAVAERLARLPDEVDLPESRLDFRFGGRLGIHAGFLQDDQICSEVRERFAAYSARYAVIAMITAFEVFAFRLLWVALAFQWISAHGLNMPTTDFYRLGNEARKKASRAGLLELVRLVCLHLAINIDFESYSAISSICQARNCLAHRGGVVGPEDVQDGRLDLTFYTLRFVLDGEPYDSIRGMHVEAGSTIGGPKGVIQRRLSVGDSLMLSPQDCQGIALTLATFADELLDALGGAVSQIIKVHNIPD